MTIIEKIKAEIERRITDNTFGAKLELIDILAWLDTLESEKPMNPEGLEEEIVKVCDDFVFPLYGLDDEFGRELINKIAHHFAQWGYLRAAEKYNEMEYNRQREEESVPNDLEEEKEAYCEEHNDDCFDATGDKCPHIRNAFIAGAKWMKEQDEKEQADLFTIVALDAAQRAREQMMKDGIEGEICHLGVDFLDYNISELDEYIKRFKVGDKVRIIIVKE